MDSLSGLLLAILLPAHLTLTRAVPSSETASHPSQLFIDPDDAQRIASIFNPTFQLFLSRLLVYIIIPNTVVLGGSVLQRSPPHADGVLNMILMSVCCYYISCSDSLIPSLCDCLLARTFNINASVVAFPLSILSIPFAQALLHWGGWWLTTLSITSH